MRLGQLILWLIGLLLPTITMSLTFVGEDALEKLDRFTDAGTPLSVLIGWWALLGSIPVGIIMCAVALFRSEENAATKVALLIGSVIALLAVSVVSLLILVVISFMTKGLSGTQ